MELGKASLKTDKAGHGFTISIAKFTSVHLNTEMCDLLKNKMDLFSCVNRQGLLSDLAHNNILHPA